MRSRIGRLAVDRHQGLGQRVGVGAQTPSGAGSQHEADHAALLRLSSHVPRDGTVPHRPGRHGPHGHDLTVGSRECEPIEFFAGRPAVVGHRGLGKGVVDGHRENSLARCWQRSSWGRLGRARRHAHMTTCSSCTTTPRTTRRFLVEQTPTAASRASPARGDLRRTAAGVAVDVDLKTSSRTRPRRRRRHRRPARAAPGARGTRRRLLVTSFDVAALLGCGRARPGARPDHLGGLPAADGGHRRRPPRARRRLPAPRVLLANAIERGPVHRGPAHSVEVAHEAGLEVLAWCPVQDRPGRAGRRRGRRRLRQRRPRRRCRCCAGRLRLK